jgi:L-amino acid N-acyltransferase YncA
MFWLDIISQWVNNYQTYPLDKTEITNEFGYITWIKEKESLNQIIVYEIYVNEKYRKHGLCKLFLTQLIDNVPKETSSIIIRAVLSKILYEFLDRFEHKGKKFKIYKGEWTYFI